MTLLYNLNILDKYKILLLSNAVVIRYILLHSILQIYWYIIDINICIYRLITIATCFTGYMFDRCTNHL